MIDVRLKFTQRGDRIVYETEWNAPEGVCRENCSNGWSSEVRVYGRGFISTEVEEEMILPTPVVQIREEKVKIRKGRDKSTKIEQIFLIKKIESTDL